MFWYPIYIKYNIGIQKFTAYQHIIIKFINKYLSIYTESDSNTAILYSKYYLNYKLNNCIYNKDIMAIILNVDSVFII